MDRILSDALENVAQVRFGIDRIELCRADQTVERGGVLAASVDPAKR